LWDEFVDSSPDASPYHRYAWGKAIADSYGFEILYLGAFEAKILKGVLPLVKMGLPFRRPSVVSLPYCDCAGALSNCAEIVTKLENHAIQLYSIDHKMPLLLRSTEFTTTPSEHIDAAAKVRMLLQLSSSEDEQMATFKSKLRSQIRKAEKNGLTANIYSFDTSEEFKTHLNDFYNVMAVNMKSLGSPVHSKRWFKEILDNYGKKAFLALVYSDDVVVGGGIVLSNGCKATIPWASTRADYNNLAPNMLLYWTVLKESIRQGATTFDFGRSTINEGTYNFKKQWGAEPVKLTWSEYNDGELVKIEDYGKSSLRDAVEKIWCKLPLSVTKFVGPKVRKYISL
jgi:FemAB-related protein (PEP-CTERM system-associated)